MSDFSFVQILRAADAAGTQAAHATTPTPMTVQEFQGIGESRRKVGNPITISEGPCGYAWVVIRPATTRFARWAKKQGFCDKNYGGGYSFSITQYGQSFEKKYAHANAFAKVLTEFNINALAEGRMD